MTDRMDDFIRIHVNLQVSSQTLQNIVANVKKNAGCDASGRYHIDTADRVGMLISRFLSERNFDDYVKDLKNYHHDNRF